MIDISLSVGESADDTSHRREVLEIANSTHTGEVGPISPCATGGGC